MLLPVCRTSKRNNRTTARPCSPRSRHQYWHNNRPTSAPPSRPLPAGRTATHRPSCSNKRATSSPQPLPRPSSHAHAARHRVRSPPRRQLQQGAPTATPVGLLPHLPPCRNRLRRPAACNDATACPPFTTAPPASRYRLGNLEPPPRHCPVHPRVVSRAGGVGQRRWEEVGGRRVAHAPGHHHHLPVVIGTEVLDTP